MVNVNKCTIETTHSEVETTPGNAQSTGWYGPVPQSSARISVQEAIWQLRMKSGYLIYTRHSILLGYLPDPKE